jgi:hypothetical protein
MPPKRKNTTSNKSSKRARTAGRSPSRTLSAVPTESGSTLPDEEGIIDLISDGNGSDSGERDDDSDMELGNISVLSKTIE